MESDPIGLAGASYSTYAYALGNPISNGDPMGLDPSAGIALAHSYLCAAKGNAQAAEDQAMLDRTNQGWEALTPEGADLRNAENYLTAYLFVQNGSNQWYGPTGAIVANAYMTPGWQLLRLIQNMTGNELQSPASIDAIQAGYQGAYDAYFYLPMGASGCGCTGGQ